jgi:hypothetical protein
VVATSFNFVYGTIYYTKQEKLMSVFVAFRAPLHACICLCGLVCAHLNLCMCVCEREGREVCV